MSDGSLQELRPVARAAFDAASRRLTELQRADEALATEAKQLRLPETIPEDSPHDVIVQFAASRSRREKWRNARLIAIESQRAALAVELEDARAEAAHAFGRLQVIRELSATPPGGRYRR